MAERSMPRNAVIVAAHPDDEILWFSSLLKTVDRLVFCYFDELADPDFGERRKKAVLAHPLKSASSIDVTSLGVRRPASFVAPTFNRYGIKLVGRRETYSVHEKKYKENYHELRTKLGPILSQYQNVFTHNPWGEYGHEEHVQVYRVVNDLQQERGFNLWYSCYCSTSTISLVAPCMRVAEQLTLPTDLDLANELMEFYERNGCWTWYEDWSWPNQETFIKQESRRSPETVNVSLVPLNLIFTPPFPRGVEKRFSRVLKKLRMLARKVGTKVS